MKLIWQASLFLAGEAVAEVIQAPALHYQSELIGPRTLMMNLKFGSQGENIRVLVDTGSSDLVIPQKDSAICANKVQECLEFGIAGGGDLQVTNSPFSVNYEGGDGYSGRLAMASMAVPRMKSACSGDGAQAAQAATTPNTGMTFAQMVQAVEAPLPAVQFSLATSRSKDADPNLPVISVFGLGPRAGEQTNTAHTTFMETMKANNKIKRNAISIVAPVEPLKMGSIYFGGYDKSKMAGTPQKVAIEPNLKGQLDKVMVRMSSLKLETNENADTAPLKRDFPREQRRATSSAWKKRMRRRYFVNKHKHRRSRYGRILVRKAAVQTRLNAPGAASPVPAAPEARENVVDLAIGTKNLLLLDTGGVDFLLPANSAGKVAASLGSTVNATDGTISPFDCRRLQGKSLVFGFNNDTVQARIPLSNFRETDTDLVDPADTQRGLCYASLLAITDDLPFSVASLTWFTAVHTTVDLDSSQVLLAQAMGNPGAPSDPANLVEL